eukprot:m.114167 g.114167  ORF g.114167 m.114167 type:complete len:297 (+) comp16281_c1_seq1:1014-1904(+)
MCETSATADGGGLAGEWLELAPNQTARILYPNPVCLLSVTANRGPYEHCPATNCMTISWLTAINNKGGFFCSMNQTRHTAELLPHAGFFVLNVPTVAQRELLLEVGGCSGRDGDKIAKLGLRFCSPGLRRAAALGPDTDASSGSHKPGHKRKRKQIERHERVLAHQDLPAWADAVAHLVCSVQRKDSHDGHNLLVCQVEAGYVRREYWSGRCFAPQQKALPGIATFLGSKVFGHVVALPDCTKEENVAAEAATATAAKAAAATAATAASATTTVAPIASVSTLQATRTPQPSLESV